MHLEYKIPICSSCASKDSEKNAVTYSFRGDLTCPVCRSFDPITLALVQKNEDKCFTTFLNWLHYMQAEFRKIINERVKHS